MRLSQTGLGQMRLGQMRLGQMGLGLLGLGLAGLGLLELGPVELGLGRRAIAGRTPKHTSYALQTSSAGTAGIDALRLHSSPYNVTGRKIALGQVEIGRPAQFGTDKASKRSGPVRPEQVFFRDRPPRTNTNVDGHAFSVASVMISTAKAMRGIAPDARLYSSAAGTPKRYGQPEECLSVQHVAAQNGGDVRAINLSFGEALRQDPRPNALLDGNALLTQCLDWSAQQHNVLYVVAGNQGKGGISIPTDNFNGMNVSLTARVAGIFRKVDFANLGDPASVGGRAIIGLESNVGQRRAIAITAPGSDITMLRADGRTVNSSGTSFAAPHVTATVALLQEYGDAAIVKQLRDRQLQSCDQGCLPPWTLDARRQEVMRAVLMNAADKLQDRGNGFYLGMSRTILDKNNRTWLESDAAQDPQIPLHIQMGTGQLNAFRAMQQFAAGQWLPGNPVPNLGWDYNRVSVPNPQGSSASSSAGGQEVVVQDYVLAQPVPQGSFVAATLVWNRRVDLLDRNRNGAFDMGEEFRDRGLNDLNLYLMPADETDSRKSVGASISAVDSVEHIFQAVPVTGRYKLRVQFKRQVNAAQQPYALAWWTKPLP
jgi:hypothetical protein